ncbi:MAG: hypothetical protein KF809_14715 [Chloroflexi bacterium]|nr:hypothetical protein [Chloroflexota bacterium]
MSVIVGIAALAAALAGPVPVAAAGPDARTLILSQASIGEKCWSAKNTVAAASISVSLRSRSGASKGSYSRGATPEGEVITACFSSTIAGDDRIDIVVDGDKRSITVPKLKVKAVDRGKDRVTVTALAGTKVTIAIHRCPLGTALGVATDLQGCTRRLSHGRTLAEGITTLDTTADLDLRGHDVVEVVHKTAAGDRLDLVRPVPTLRFDVRTASLWGVLLPSTSGKLQLRTASGTQRATVTIAGSQSGRAAKWRKSGSPILAKPGNRVAGSASPNSGFTDLPVTLPAGLSSAKAASDVIKGTCFPGRRYRITGPDIQTVAGSASPNGGFTEVTPGLDPGDTVTLECLSPDGDVMVDLLKAS